MSSDPTKEYQNDPLTMKSRRRRGSSQKRFPVDPKLALVPGTGGRGKIRQPPEGHPRRCQAPISSDPGRQCSHWAERGYNRCRFHRRGSRKGHLKKKEMAGTYSKHVGRKLRELIEAAGEEIRDHFDLLEEIEVAKAMCTESLKVLSAVMDNEAKVRPGMRSEAIACVQESLTHVSTLVEKAARISVLRKQYGDAPNVEFITAQFAYIVQEELADNPELAARVVKRIDDIKTTDIGKAPTVQIAV